MIKQSNKKLFLLLSLAFIIATIIGTLSHEFGHYIVAKNLGYKASIHYASASKDAPASFDTLDTIISKYRKQIEEGSSFPGKEKYDQLARKHSNNRLLITMGGPLQTMLTGTIGLILLFVWRNSFRSGHKLTPRQWTLVFIALFWLRQAASLIVWLGIYLVTKKFSYEGDEVKIALQLGLPFWLLITMTGIFGLIIVSMVVFKFVPRTQRVKFVSAGIVGAVAGFVLWFYLLGPVLLP